MSCHTNFVLSLLSVFYRLLSFFSCKSLDAGHSGSIERRRPNFGDVELERGCEVFIIPSFLYLSSNSFPKQTSYNILSMYFLTDFRIGEIKGVIPIPGRVRAYVKLVDSANLSTLCTRIVY